MRFALPYHLLTTDFLYILLSPFHFVLLYGQNILLSRNFFFHIDLNLHAYPISSVYSYLTNCVTPRYDCILTNIWISSGHAYASMISNFFLTQFSNDLYYICSSFFVYHFSSVFWCKYYVILVSIFGIYNTFYFIFPVSHLLILFS